MYSREHVQNKIYQNLLLQRSKIPNLLYALLLCETPVRLQRIILTKTNVSALDIVWLL